MLSGRWMLVIVSVNGDESHDETKECVVAIGTAHGTDTEWAAVEKCISELMPRRTETSRHAADFERDLKHHLYKTKVIAQKDRQREVMIQKLRILDRSAEVNCHGDMGGIHVEWFQAASTTKVPPSPLPLPVVRSVDHGAMSGEIVIQIQAVPRALSYEIRYGAQGNGGPPSSWTSTVVTRVKPPSAFQV